MIQTLKILSFTLILSLLAQGCGSSFQSVLKSTDREFKYAKALEFYEKGQYYKAIPVIEELLSIYKGTERAEELYYYYCQSHYKGKNYLMAAFHFNSYYNQFPNSKNAEEALYLYANSHDQQSPKSSLDQASTHKAIEAYQLFANSYPTSERLALVNAAIEKLRRKLEVKALDSAKLYDKTGNHRAAAIYFENTISDFPDIDEAENLAFLSVLSQYEFAENSVISKKPERYLEAINKADRFKSRYPASKSLDEIAKLKAQSHFKVIESSFDDAVLSSLRERHKKLRRSINLYKQHVSRIDETKKKPANELLEESYFQLIRTGYLLGQNSSGSRKERAYSQAIKAYYDFIDRYTSSKFAREAEKIFDASTRNLKKLKDGQT